MAYNALKNARIKDVLAAINKVKTITDDHEQRLAALEELAETARILLNAFIDNVEREAE